MREPMRKWLKEAQMAITMFCVVPALVFCFVFAAGHVMVMGFYSLHRASHYWYERARIENIETTRALEVAAGIYEEMHRE